MLRDLVLLLLPMCVFLVGVVGFLIVQATRGGAPARARPSTQAVPVDIAPPAAPPAPAAALPEALLAALLEPLDNLDRALQVEASEPGARAILEGLARIRDQLLRALSLLGLEAVEVGAATPFDPRVHEAVATSGAGPRGEVWIVMRRGFLKQGRLLRPAQVVVGTAEPRPADQGEPSC